MYEEFFGLKEPPFRLPPDPEYLFLSHEHRLALVHLQYGLQQHAGFIVITGEIGTGKTTLIKSLIKDMSSDIVVASIFNTTVGPDLFINLVLDDFEIPYSGNDLHTVRLEKLNAFLIDSFASGRTVALIVDEAQNLSLETLEEIRLMSNLQTEKDYLIHIFLVGQPELKLKLAHPSLRQLAQRIAVHYHINPLSQQETTAYIAHRLEMSGAEDIGDFFAPDALEEIYRHAKGIPRLVNLLCDACLVNAFADQVRPVDRRCVDDTVKGDGAGNFWQIAAPEAVMIPEDAGCKTDLGFSSSPDANFFSGMNAMEERISELERSVQLLTGMVNEKMLQEPSQTGRIAESRETLMLLLEKEQKKVLRLVADRVKLLEKIDRLSSQDNDHVVPESDSEAEINEGGFLKRLFAKSHS